MNIQLIILLTLGIILIKSFWISTEIRYFKNRLNWEMFKTNAVEAGILTAQIFQAIYFPLPTSPWSTFLTTGGVVMYVTGFILSLWAKFTMDKVWGIPGKDSANQNALVTNGPFSFSRNPIYVGFLLIYFGFAIALLSPLLVLRIPLLIYFYKSAKEEEKILEKKFGEKYLSYKKTVPRFF